MLGFIAPTGHSLFLGALMVLLLSTSTVTAQAEQDDEESLQVSQAECKSLDEDAGRRYLTEEELERLRKCVEDGNQIPNFFNPPVAVPGSPPGFLLQ